VFSALHQGHPGWPWRQSSGFAVCSFLMSQCMGHKCKCTALGVGCCLCGRQQLLCFLAFFDDLGPGVHLHFWFEQCVLDDLNMILFQR